MGRGYDTSVASVKESSLAALPESSQTQWLRTDVIAQALGAGLCAMLCAHRHAARLERVGVWTPKPRPRKCVEGNEKPVFELGMKLGTTTRNFLAI